MSKKYVLLVLGLFVLLGCSRTPMIRLSEERKAELAQETLKEKNEKNIEIEFSKKSFIEADSDVIYTQVTDFLPLQPNTVVEGENVLEYMDYIDTQNRMLQIYHQEKQVHKRDFYHWDDQGIYYLGSQDTSVFPVNNLSIFQPTENKQMLIKFPITKGNQWSVDSDKTGSVTNIYREATIGNQIYTDLVEITFKGGGQDEVIYLASGVGIVARQKSEANQIKETYEVNQIRQESLVQANFSVYSAQDENDSIKLIETTSLLKWQTNDQLSNVYTRLFRDLGWIDTTVTVNSIEILDNQAIVDFTPGVVAVLNSHPQTEKGLIPAIVVTMARSLQVDQVKLTVNGFGLLPDTLEYPVGGVWLIDSDWLE